MNMVPKHREILVCVRNYLPGYKAGGILRTIVNTVDHLGGEFDFKILTSDRDLGEDKPYPGIRSGQWQRVGGAMVYYLPPKSCTIRGISKVISDTSHDILYLNGFFDPVVTMKILMGRMFRLLPDKPVILAPRGEHCDGPLKLKYSKKIIFIRIAKLLHLYRNLIWQASSELEAQDIIGVMKVDPALVHVACDLPLKSPSTVEPEAPDKGEGGTLRCIFLNRLTREKNLDYALNVLSKVKTKLIFDIYGPAEDPIYWSECKAIIQNLPRNVSVNYCGCVSPIEVLSIFSRYDLFFFPSRGENYGHVIAESLTAGTPVLISDKTPWRNLQIDDLGWDIDLSDMNSFVKIIESFALLPSPERSEKRTLLKTKIKQRLLDPAVLEANRQLFLRMLTR